MLYPQRPFVSPQVEPPYRYSDCRRRLPRLQPFQVTSMIFATQRQPLESPRLTLDFPCKHSSAAVISHFSSRPCFGGCLRRHSARASLSCINQPLSMPWPRTERQYDRSILPCSFNCASDIFTISA